MLNQKISVCSDLKMPADPKTNWAAQTNILLAWIFYFDK